MPFIEEHPDFRCNGLMKENQNQAPQDRKPPESKSPQQLFSKARMHPNPPTHTYSHPATRMHTEGNAHTHEETVHHHRQIEPHRSREGAFDWKHLKKGDLEMLEVVGQGTFGQVFKAKVRKTGEVVAVKRVFQDPKYKNR